MALLNNMKPLNVHLDMNKIWLDGDTIALVHARPDQNLQFIEPGGRVDTKTGGDDSKRVVRVKSRYNSGSKGAWVRD